jgi:hypothetical protein
MSFLEEMSQLRKKIDALETDSKKRVIDFSRVRDADLDEMRVSIRFGENKFNQWFNSKIDIDSQSLTFLTELLKKEREFLRYYNEEDLKVNFLIPILNRIDFKILDLEVRAFYKESLNIETDNLVLKGVPDFFISKGLFRSETPLFFIQKFNKGRDNSFIEFQLVAEMVAGLEVSKLQEIKGAYVVGSIWNFVILEKLEEGYNYSVSRNFDSSREDDLKEIYKNLLYIKSEIIEMCSKSGT